MGARPSRRHPAHPAVIQTLEKPTIVFVTVCTANRKPILARHDAHQILDSAWRQADEWLVGRYVLMPDHVHLFCAPRRLDSCPLTNWIRFWKSIATRNWPRPEERPLWQTDHWDRQLRTDERYADKWDYVRMNPVRQKLVPRVEDWPYQGELNVLGWR
jgi:putative transposase